MMNLVNINCKKLKILIIRLLKLITKCFVFDFRGNLSPQSPSGYSPVCTVLTQFYSAIGPNLRKQIYFVHKVRCITANSSDTVSEIKKSTDYGLSHSKKIKTNK